MSQEIKCESLDILCDVLHKFGNLMATDHELLLGALLSQLSSTQASVRKKTVSCIGKIHWIPCSHFFLPQTCISFFEDLKAVWIDCCHSHLVCFIFIFIYYFGFFFYHSELRVLVWVLSGVLISEF